MPPRHNASQVVDAVDFAGTNGTRNDDLKAFRPFLPLKMLHCAGRNHALMGAAVMPHPDRFGIEDAEIQSSHLYMTALLQFAQPLVRNKKAPCDRHGKNATRMIVLRPQTRYSIVKDRVDVLFRSEMNKDHHGMLDALSALSLWGTVPPAGRVNSLRRENPNGYLPEQAWRQILKACGLRTSVFFRAFAITCA